MTTEKLEKLIAMKKKIDEKKDMLSYLKSKVELIGVEHKKGGVWIYNYGNTHLPLDTLKMIFEIAIVQVERMVKDLEKEFEKE